MKNHNYDKNGIPIISRTDIEYWAEKFLTYFDDTCFERPQATPLASICQRLKDDFDVKFVFSIDLGNSPEGYRYRGRFHIPSQTIFIDKSLEWNDPRYNFTLAHEIAHFVMHRKIDASILGKDKEITDTNRQLILDHVQSDNPRDWIEWQANKFASSLLLPRQTVPIAVVQKQKELGISSRIGTIYLDRQQSNLIDFKIIMDHLVSLYETSKASIRIRLKELNILIESSTIDKIQGKGIEPVGHVLHRFFSEI